MSDESPPPRKAGLLLGELERIKDMLEGVDHEPDNASQDADSPDIPLLQDVVDDNAAPLDLEHIFDDRIPAASPAAGDSPDATLDLGHLDHLDIDFPRFTLESPEADTQAAEDAPDDDLAASFASADDSTRPDDPVADVPDGAAPTESSDDRRIADSDSSDAGARALIDQLVAEFVPQIESELRRRLEARPLHQLRQLSDPDHDRNE